MDIKNFFRPAAPRARTEAASDELPTADRQTQDAQMDEAGPLTAFDPPAAAERHAQDARMDEEPLASVAAEGELMDDAKQPRRETLEMSRRKVVKQPPPPPPPPPPPVVPTDGAASGKRKIVPTMVQVGSQFVKRQNMYDMASGERSVFDAECGARDAAFAPRDRPTLDRDALAAAAAPVAAKAPAREYVPSAAEKRRVENNNTIKADTEVLKQRRGGHPRFENPTVPDLLSLSLRNLLRIRAHRSRRSLPAARSRSSLLCHPSQSDRAVCRRSHARICRRTRCHRARASVAPRAA